MEGLLVEEASVVVLFGEVEVVGEVGGDSAVGDDALVFLLLLQELDQVLHL